MNAPNSSPTQRRRAVQLTLRDLALLSEAADNPPLPLDVLATRHFRGVRKTALNRLRLLVRAGYLTAEPIQLLDRPGRELFYAPTGKAKSTLARRTLLGERFSDA